MKKMIIIILTAMMFAGCTLSKVEKVEKPKEDISRFEIVESTFFGGWLQIKRLELCIWCLVEHAIWEILRFWLTLMENL